jgi:hypothetical protein
MPFDDCPEESISVDEFNETFAFLFRSKEEDLIPHLEGLGISVDRTDPNYYWLEGSGYKGAIFNHIQRVRIDSEQMFDKCGNC